MVNETLADQSKSYVSFLILNSLADLLLMQLPVPFKNLFLHWFGFHRNHVPLASRIILFVTFGEIVEIMSAQIKFAQIVDFFDYLTLFLSRWDFTAFEIFVLLENPHRNNVIIHSCQCVMSHVKTFDDSHDFKHSYIDW
jgi:hypothetical protein